MPKETEMVCTISLVTGHSNQRFLCVGRLLNYEDFGGGDTGDKKVD